MTSDPRTPKLSRSQREAAQRDQFFSEIVSENLQLKRTLWLALRTSGSPTLTIDQVEMSLLWNLQYSEVPGAPTKLTLTASLHPEITPKELACLRELLVDTDGALQDVRKHETVNRPELPLGYLQMKLMDGDEGIVWKADLKKWVRKPLTAQEPPPSHAPV